MLWRWVGEPACVRATHLPPATTRAHLRGTAIGRAEDLRLDLSADWVNLKLDDGRSAPVALRDPFATSDPRVDALLETMDTLAAAREGQVPTGV